MSMCRIIVFFSLLAPTLSTTWNLTESQFKVDHSDSFISHFENFLEIYWKDNRWRGASEWTSDLIDRNLLRYLGGALQKERDTKRVSQFIETAFTHIVNRALSRKDLLLYFTQANDDFGWTTAKMLDAIEFSYEFERRCPNSPLSPFLPPIRNRLAFRASFFLEVVRDSWSSEFCGGGVEWFQRSIKNTAWPALSSIYKNTITNHLYVSNCAQSYNAYPTESRPVELTEIAITYVRFLWKRIRLPFGWVNDQHDFSFQDVGLLEHTIEGLDWMHKVDLLTKDSLYADGYPVTAEQGESRATLDMICGFRNDAVFTYNQLSSLRALKWLFEANGDHSLLDQGYTMISNVIKATQSGPLGFGGVLEETCDQSGCNIDQQAFKGATFIDLIDFCRRIQRIDTPEEVFNRHRNICRSYQPFVNINAVAAYSTIDNEGLFGGIWGPNTEDLNKRGRGRTIETQQSALAVLTASLVFDHI